MTIRFYLDDDSADRRLLAALRDRDIDCEAPWDAGLYGAADERHLSYAAADGRTLVSSNVRHFLALHSRWMSAGRSHAGIVLIVQQRYSVGEQLRRLVRLSDALEPAEMVDRCEFLADWGAEAE